MKFLLNFEGPVQSFFSKIGDYALLNFLWLICSIPIITMGAATTALNYVTIRMTEGSQVYIFKEFFQSFKMNIKQSTIVWVIMIAIGMFIYVDYTMIVNQFEKNIILLLALSFFTLIYLFVFFYVFACIARFENTTIQHIKNAFFIALSNVKKTIIVFLITFVTFFMFTLSMKTFLLAGFISLTVGISILSHIFSFVWYSIFVKVEKNFYHRKNRSMKSSKNYKSNQITL